MAHVFKKTITRYLDATGQRVTKTTPGAKKVRDRTDVYYGRYRDADGRIHEAKLYTDKAASRTRLNELNVRAQRLHAGLADPFEDAMRRPLIDHVLDYKAALKAKGNAASHIGPTIARIKAILVAGKFERILDLNATRVSTFLADLRESKANEAGELELGLGIATTNAYITAVKGFCTWLVREQRMGANPLVSLQKMNAETDVRRERRALTQEELSWLIKAAECSNRIVRGLSGPDRAVLYVVAVFTGLREGELASLTESSFALDAEMPIVTVQAAYSKHKRRDELPLHPVLVKLLRDWFAKRRNRLCDQTATPIRVTAHSERTERLWPGTWASNRRAAEVVRLDLETARAAWLKEVEGDPERMSERDQSDFLRHLDSQNKRVDFHALRHSFITHLVQSDVHPKMAQGLARHSTIGLTMDRYTHLKLFDLKQALHKLPAIPAHEGSTVPRLIEIA